MPKPVADVRIKLPPRMRDRLKRVARAEGRSIAWIGREVLTHYVERAESAHRGASGGGDHEEES